MTKDTPMTTIRNSSHRTTIDKRHNRQLRERNNGHKNALDTTDKRPNNMFVSKAKMQQELITNATKDTSHRRPHEKTHQYKTRDHTRKEDSQNLL